MFTKKTEKVQEQRANNVSLVANGTEITGDIQSSVDLRIDGRVNGAVHCTAKLAVGESGHIKGNITCDSAEISGTVRGQIFAKDILQLNGSASIQGDMEAARFVVADGASIRGKCTTSNSLDLPTLPEVKLIAYEKPQPL